jgi:hypothetical protein
VKRQPPHCSEEKPAHLPEEHMVLVQCSVENITNILGFRMHSRLNVDVPSFVRQMSMDKVRCYNSGRMKVLVTGGAGFIGSHLAETLLREGGEVAILDNFDPFYPEVWKRRNLEDVQRLGTVTLFEADICDEIAVERAFDSFDPGLLVHLAARAGVRPSIEKPALYEQVNVAGTLNLLEAARRHGLKAIVFGSSSSVYGESSPAPFREDN